MRNLVTRFIFFTMIASGLLLWNAACVKDCDMRDKTYHFQIPISLLNYSDTMKVGDTIIVRVFYTPNYVLNSQNGKYEDLTNVSFHPSVFIYKTDTSDPAVFDFGLKYFKFICPIKNGCEYVYTQNSMSVQQLNHFVRGAEVTDSFMFIAQKKGIYHIEMNSSNYSNRGGAFPGKCPRSSYRFEWAYDEKYNNDRLTQYVQYCKIEGMKKYLMNTDPQKFTFGVYVK